MQQLDYENENFDFKPALLHLKIDQLSHTARGGKIRLIHTVASESLLLGTLTFSCAHVMLLKDSSVLAYLK